MSNKTVTYRYEVNQAVRGTTLTVAGLKEALNQYPDDMPVFGGWEGVLGFIGDMTIDEQGKNNDFRPVLVIDVEDY